MPNAFISLLIDAHTETSLTEKRKAILDMVNEHISITIDEKFDKKARSRYLKTSMRRYITGDFLYIDGDTIIAEDLSSLEETDIIIGAVLDAHVFLSEYGKYYPAKLKKMKAYATKLGLDSYFDLNVRYNGGVFLCKDCKTGHDFFNEWHKLWLYTYEKGAVTDQQSLNQANFNLGNVIKELDGIWNCQILDDGALRYLYDAKIIHYFATQTAGKPFLPANNEYIESIKTTGMVSDEIRKMLIKPKTLFASNTRLLLIEKQSLEFYNSASFGAAKRIYYTKFGSVIEFILSGIKKRLFIPLKKKLSKRK
jgi:lipopolysaccharide biosynthesis glycosyltransferase